MDCCGRGDGDEPPAGPPRDLPPPPKPREWDRWCGVRVVPIDAWPPRLRVERDGQSETIELRPARPRDTTQHRCYMGTWRGERVFVKWMEEGEGGARHADDEHAAAIAAHAMGGIPGVAPFASGLAPGVLGVVGVTVALHRPEYTPKSERHMVDVLRLMAALDRAGVAYLDLKVSNLVAGPAGRPEIVDVGSLYPPARPIGRGTELQITYLPADLDRLVPFERLTFDYQPPGAVAWVHDVDDDDPVARREVRIEDTVAVVLAGERAPPRGHEGAQQWGGPPIRPWSSVGPLAVRARAGARLDGTLPARGRARPHRHRVGPAGRRDQGLRSRCCRETGPRGRRDTVV